MTESATPAPQSEPTAPAPQPDPVPPAPQPQPGSPALEAEPTSTAPRPKAGAATVTAADMTSGTLPRVTIVSGPKRPVGRLPLVLAAFGIVAALAAGAVLALRGPAAPPISTPEETVREFLAAVFLARDPQRVGPVVCASWDPADAIERTTAEFDGDVRVSWDGVGVVTADPDRVTVRARLGLRPADDVRPSSYAQWRFSLVSQDGWRVCEARPFVG